MNNIILTTLIYFITSFSLYASSPNGKGIICECKSKKCEYKSGYLFSEKIVQNYFFSQLDDKINFEKGADTYYQRKANEIIWEKFEKHSLNRSNLSLKSVLKNKYVKAQTTLSQCDVFSKVDFYNEMEKLKRKYQIKYDKILKKNKI